MKDKKEEEPKVLTVDVQRVINRVLQSEHEEEGLSVATLAEKAKTSTRTVYRVIAGERKALSLKLADDLCVAADSHVGECRLLWADGRITSYYD